MKTVDDPIERAGRQASRTRAAVEHNGAVFGPLGEAMAEAVRRGGRLLLVGERRLHAIAQYAAAEIVGRRHRSGVQLPAEALDVSLGEPAAVARRVGPFDAVIAIARNGDEALFNGTIEAARARGAKVLCICVGRTMLQGRADVAVDIPETRPHHIPGLVAMVLHYLSKLALARLAANPLVRPQRLDEGPRKAAAAASAGAEGAAFESPSSRDSRRQPLAAPADVLPLLEAEDEPTITLEIPEDALEIDFFEGVAEAARRAQRAEGEKGGGLDLRGAGETGGAVEAGGAGASPPAGESALAPRPLSPSPGEGTRDRPIRYRCKQCGFILVAMASHAGRRSQCPKCGRRVKVPRGPKMGAKGEKAFSPGAEQPSEKSALTPRPAIEMPAVAPEPRPVTLRVRLEDCALSIRLAGDEWAPSRVVEIQPEGVEGVLPAATAARLEKGEEVEIRLEAPAFLEPLVARALVERVLPDEAEPGGARVLLPIEEGAPRDVREKLTRLSDLVEKASIG